MAGAQEEGGEEAGATGERPEQEEADRFESVADELEKLKKELQKAVENEEYEKAARIRDKIKQIESNS